jgi:hypothetical protein
VSATHVCTDPATPAEQFRRWLEANDPDAPATLVYWTGWLVADIEVDRAVRELAGAVLHASGALPASKTGHARELVHGDAGPALVALTQRRLGPGRYEYLATKLARRHREDPTR